MMSEQEFDVLMRSALLQISLSDVAEAQTAEPPFSPRYLRARLRLLANPFGWRRRRERPVWKRVLRGATCLLLVCALSLAAVLTVSPIARAKVRQWVLEQYEMYSNYRFSGEPSLEELPQFTVGALPEDFVEAKREVGSTNVFVTYENGTGERIYLSYMQMQQGSLMGISMENMQMREVQVNKLLGELYISSDPLQSHTVIWRDENRNLAFSLDAHGNEQDILHMAESVILVE